jgi:hypothetical protein
MKRIPLFAKTHDQRNAYLYFGATSAPYFVRFARCFCALQSSGVEIRFFALFFFEKKSRGPWTGEGYERQDSALVEPPYI